MISKTLEPGEQIVIEVRRHWFVFASRVVGLLFIALLPAVFLYFFQSQPVLATLWAGVPLNMVYFLWSLWLIVLWVLLFSSWLHYYLDVWIVTNKRLVDFEFKGFFRYETSSMRLDRIQDITIEVDGLLANLFHFGSMHVETAGEVSNTFIIKNAANPERVKQIIFGAHNQVMDKRPQAEN